MIAYFTRVVRFSAAHRYHRPEWSDEKNTETFGACANPHGHGHNYVLEVTVSGTPDPLTGFSVDLAALDAALRQQVVEPLDHQHINHAIPEFGPGKLIPTTENLVGWIWKRLTQHGLPAPATLVKLRLFEQPDLFVDYLGESEGGAPRDSQRLA